jgi:hypothetical protein
MTGGNRHVDLIGMLSGELPPAERAGTLDHVLGCDQCRYQLTETAALIGELKDAGRHSPVDPSEVPPLDLAALKMSAAPLDPPVIEPHLVESRDRDDLAVPAAPQHPPMRRRFVTLTVAAGLIGALVGGIAIGHSLQASKPPAAEVRLSAVGQPPTPATGAARMLGSGAAQKMHVTLSGLTLPSAADTVEVWLLNTRTGQTRAIGTMPVTTTPVMTATFPLPASDLSGYDAVDVSIQSPSDHGEHSSHSVLRGAVA